VGLGERRRSAGVSRWRRCRAGGAWAPAWVGTSADGGAAGRGRRGRRRRQRASGAYLGRVPPSGGISRLMCPDGISLRWREITDARTGSAGGVARRERRPLTRRCRTLGSELTYGLRRAGGVCFTQLVRFTGRWLAMAAAFRPIVAALRASLRRRLILPDGTLAGGSPGVSCLLAKLLCGER
jgi:hypothetical protein